MVENTRKSIEVAEGVGSDYPEPFGEPCKERSNRNLARASGLSKIGAQLFLLPPGAWSSQRHWHTHEDELVYVLEGAPTLITDEGEVMLEPGDFVGFPAGQKNGHHIVNRGSLNAKFLTVSNQDSRDDVSYSDIDMQINGRSFGGAYTNKRGEAYPIE
ncbi:MAG: cupin domain-containing protein [Halioglobus sp.]